MSYRAESVARLDQQQLARAETEPSDRPQRKNAGFYA
jgi:hypothetical protein